jgi:hypothetical protein
MKKILMAFLLATTLQQANACDICGGVNHLNPYMFPHLSKSYVSITYLRSRFSSIEEGNKSKITGNTIMLSGQFTLNSQLQLTAFVPYQFNHTEIGLSSASINGVGDISLLANYNLVTFSTASIKHTASTGAGIKLPTGRYEAGNAVASHNEMLKPGTGSIDYILNGAYRASIQNFAVNTNVTYKYNTPNDNGYRYGDVMTTSATVVYVINQKDLSLVPYVQLVNEHHYRDADNHLLQAASGGRVLFTGGGLDISTDRFTVGANYQVAATQNLMQGNLTARPKFSARLSFTL